MKKYIYDTYLHLAGLKRALLVRRVNSRKRPIKLYWWHAADQGITNFGDEISRDIIKSLFGYECEYAPIDECELMATGSIVEIAQKRESSNPIHVWGSGFIREDSETESLDGLKFHAVRGELTRARIGDSLPVGDPGLLASLVYEQAKRRTDKIGVVVHYIDADMPIVEQIRADDRFMVIDPLDKPSDVAKRITECKLILSSSLHGLIFADSYGIPNRHVVFSDRVTGGDYKFRDYYSATGRSYWACDVKQIFSDEYHNRLLDSYEKVNGLKAIQKGLVKAFPDSVID